jgi:hypothetical protein
MTKPSDKTDNTEQKISTVSNPIKCREEECNRYALSFFQYCWKHMPEEEKANYKQKIEDWHKKGKSLKRFILNGANLSGAWFIEANLSRADLWRANLSRAELRGANLSGAKLWRSNLSGADLRGTNLSEADLRGANLSGAELYEANLRDAILIWADLTNAKGLRISCFTEKLSDKEKENPKEYQESYLFVKNYFIRMGLYDDASEAAYREKVLQRLSYLKDFWLEAHIEYKKKSGWVRFSQRLKYIILNPYISLKTFFKILGSQIIDDLCGYGEKPKLTVRAAFEIIGFFTVFYWLIGKFEQSLGFIDSLYFSVVTFTTLGLGDIKPLSTSLLTRIAVASEALIGAFMIALFVWTLARRGAAR